MRVITDYRTARESVECLKSLGCEVILTKRLAGVYKEIDGHTDIQLHYVNNKLICAPGVYDYYKAQLPQYDIVCGRLEPMGKYPYDIAYNSCRIGNYLVCRRSYTDEVLLSEYENSGVKILDTKQGYAKCSICVVSHNAAITSDDGIYRLLSYNGIDTLKIRPGFIELYGMTGFIGGASGLIGKGLLAFNGNLDTHPDGENIKAFCKNTGVDTVSLKDGMLTDVGTVVGLD